MSKKDKHELITEFLDLYTTYQVAGNYNEDYNNFEEIILEIENIMDELGVNTTGELLDVLWKSVKR